MSRSSTSRRLMAWFSRRRITLRSKPGPGIVHAARLQHDAHVVDAAGDGAAAQGSTCSRSTSAASARAAGRASASGTDQQSIIDSNWPGDVDAALAWLSSQPGVDKTRIGATGASCGVNQAVQLAKRHPEVKTVVLLSGGVNEGGAPVPARLARVPGVGGREPRRQRRGRSDALGAWLVAQPVEQVRRIQSGRARHRHVRGREGARAGGPRPGSTPTFATRRPSSPRLRRQSRRRQRSSGRR